MAEVDTSIYNRLMQPVDPTAQTQKNIDLFRTAIAGRQQRMELESRQAAGQAYQAATDPATGQFDNARFNRLIASSPAAAYGAGQALREARGLQGQQIGIQAAQAERGIMQLGNLRQSLTSLLARPPGSVTRQQVQDEVHSILALPEDQRPFSVEIAATQLAGLPSDPGQIHGWLLQHAANTDAGIAHLSQFLPQQQGYDAGDATVFRQTNPLAPGYSGGVPVGRTISPDQRYAPIPTNDPVTNAPRLGTREQLGLPTPPPTFGSGRYNDPAATPPIGAPAAPPAVPQAAPAPRAAAPSQAPTPPAAAPAPQAAAAPTGPGVVIGPSPFDTRARNAAVDASAGAANDLTTQAAQVPQMRTALDNLQSQLGRFTPGAGAEWRKEAFSLWNSVVGESMRVNTDGVAAQEEFNKNAALLANQQFQALGGTGTDRQLSAAAGVSPSSHLSREGNQRIVALLQGNNDALEAKARAWQASGQSPAQYRQWESDFNKRFNPRVYQFQHLPPGEVAKLFNGLSQEDRRKLLRDEQYAVQQNYLNTNGAPGALQRLLDSVRAGTGRP